MENNLLLLPSSKTSGNNLSIITSLKQIVSTYVNQYNLVTITIVLCFARTIQQISNLVLKVLPKGSDGQKEKTPLRSGLDG